ADRRARREYERDRPAGDPETLRSGQSGRRTVAAEETMNAYPKLHNAMWPGLVGKGSPGAEPAIDLDTMLDLTGKASVNGVTFDGVDLFVSDPHVSIDSSDADLRQLADKMAAKGFVVGSLVAPG